ncbi:MAG: MFS transporter [Cyanobacteria bacterium P01_A01_bin.45]
MSSSSSSKSKSAVLWTQIWSLAGLQGAIALTWLIYNVYLSQLLAALGFSREVALDLVLLENSVAIFLEPLMGLLSDNAKRSKGSRFDFIWGGVTVSSILFISIPLVFNAADPGTISEFLPILLVSWTFSTMAFRAPAIATLREYTPSEELPTAASAITLVWGVITSFRPVGNEIIFDLSPIGVFAIGSIALLAAATRMRTVNLPKAPIDNSDANPKGIIRELGLIFGAGAGIGLGSRLLINTISNVLVTQLGVNNNWELIGIGIVVSLTAVPAGIIASRIGITKATLYGIGATMILMVLIVFTNAQIAVIMLLIASFSLVLNGGIPFALSTVPPKWSGLGVGTFFAGISLSLTLLYFLFPDLQSSDVVGESVGGAIAFLLAGLCIASSK